MRKELVVGGFILKKKYCNPPPTRARVNDRVVVALQAAFK